MCVCLCDCTVQWSYCLELLAVFTKHTNILAHLLAADKNTITTHQQQKTCTHTVLTAHTNQGGGSLCRWNPDLCCPCTLRQYSGCGIAKAIQGVFVLTHHGCIIRQVKSFLKFQIKGWRLNIWCGTPLHVAQIDFWMFPNYRKALLWSC